MSTTTPLYNAAPAGPAQDRITAVFGHVQSRVPLSDLLDPLGTDPPGVVLVDPAACSVAELQALDRRGPGWIPAVLDDSEPTGVRALSFSPSDPVDRVSDLLANPHAHPGVLMMLQEVLRDTARMRHDVNNPLTSALAETQMLLLDVPDGEVREGLEVIQDQLRRIRDVVAATGYLRPPRT